MNVVEREVEVYGGSLRLKYSHGYELVFCLENVGSGIVKCGIACRRSVEQKVRKKNRGALSFGCEGAVTVEIDNVR